MKYEYFYTSGINDKSNCVVRSFCKLYEKDYDDVFNELCLLAKELNKDSFNDTIVFEEYMKRRNTLPISYGKDLLVKNLMLNDGEYIIFCYDKKDFYHMVPVINNVIYDKTDECLELYVINIYEKNI